MKLTSSLLFAFVALALTAAKAQAPATAKPHTAPHATAASSHPLCAKVPELSAQIPALPPGTPCARSLYTITTNPSVKLSDVSPLESPTLRTTLGVEPTSFSLDYIDTKIGTGEIAAPHKWYTVHYTGYLVDGTKFDSSYDHPDKLPFVFPYGQHQVVLGWDTGLDGMRVGGKRRLFIPWQLAYGPNAHGNIPPKSELIFDIELIGQSDKAPASAASTGNPGGMAGGSIPVVTVHPATPAKTPSAEPTATPSATAAKP